MMRYFFFFNDTSTTEIYTLSLHDALPISPSVRGDIEPFDLSRAAVQLLHRHASDRAVAVVGDQEATAWWRDFVRFGGRSDRKSTRLNSSHANISYAVFCLKKKKIHKH